MSATAAHIARVRRLVSEPTETTYSDETISEYVERYPLIDADGYEPDDTDWTATYDLHAAAADIWDEKAAAVASDYDFSADGSSLQRSQVVAAYQRMARAQRALRSMGLVSLVPKEPESEDSQA